MKSLISKVIIGLAALGFATSAFALRPYAAAVTYFNSTGAIIGADIIDCDNNGWHEGVQNSQYYTYAYGGCTSPYSSKLLPGTGVANYDLPGAETIAQACSTSEVQCLGGTLNPSPINTPGLTWSIGWVAPTVSP